MLLELSQRDLRKHDVKISQLYFEIANLINEWWNFVMLFDMLYLNFDMLKIYQCYQWYPFHSYMLLKYPWRLAIKFKNLVGIRLKYRS